MNRNLSKENFIYLFFNSLLYLLNIILNLYLLIYFIDLNLVVFIIYFTINFLILICNFLLTTLTLIEYIDIKNHKKKYLFFRIYIGISSMLNFLLCNMNYLSFSIQVKNLLIITAISNLLILFIPLIFLILITLYFVLIYLFSSNNLTEEIVNDDIKLIEIKDLENESNLTCTICLEKINEIKIRKLDCNHNFHIKCLDEWLKINNSCPICRDSILNPIV